MYEYLFTFRSLTQAQLAQNVLRQNRVVAEMQRSPKRLSKNGCAYALSISNAQLYEAIRIFRERKLQFKGLYRKIGAQELEEVQL